MRETALRHGDRRRRSILRAALDVCSAEGLEGVSIGRLAREVGLSKSGLAAHYDSKQALQHATVDAAAEGFEAVVDPEPRPRSRPLAEQTQWPTRPSPDRVGAPLALDFGLVTVPLRMFASTDSFVLLAAPFFILVGDVMARGGITDRVCSLGRGHGRGQQHEQQHGKKSCHHSAPIHRIAKTSRS